METGTTDSSGTTINRSKNRLGLLLKQYYDDPSGLNNNKSDYSLEKLQKLSTDPLMARAVESLRSYKEAESDLRMLLYNNCDKLLEAVQVVCAIRDGSWDLAEEGTALTQAAKNLNSGSVSGPVQSYREVVHRQDVVGRLEMLAGLPKNLRSSITSNLVSPSIVEEKIRFFLKISEELFDPLTSTYPSIAAISSECRKIVDSDLVPVLMNDSAHGSLGSSSPRKSSSVRATRLNLLLELYPSGHAKRAEIMQQFIELEIAGFDDKLTKKTSNVRESLLLFNSVINILFLAQDLSITELEEKLRDDVLLRASRNIVTAIARDKSDGMGEFIEEAISAHSRIPLVSQTAVAEFTQAAVASWIQGQFSTAAKICLTEDLPALLAAGSYGACCDVIHTRCCAAVVNVYEFLSSAEFVGDISSFLSQIVGFVRDYYEAVTLSALGVEEMPQTLTKQLKMNKFLLHRKTVDRTLNAVSDIFSEDVDNRSAVEGVVPLAVHRAVRLLGEWTGTQSGNLEIIVEEISRILDSASSGPGNQNRFSVPTELDMAETVHARKLRFKLAADSPVSLEQAVSMILCIHLRNVREATLSGDSQLDRENCKSTVKRLATRFIGQDDSEHMQAVSAMLKDL